MRRFVYIFVVLFLFVYSSTNKSYSFDLDIIKNYPSQDTIVDCNTLPNCVSPKDNGGNITVVVSSNPELVKSSDYVPDADRSIQKAFWTDPVLRLNGTRVEILIMGSWTPWFGRSQNDASLKPSSSDYCMITKLGNADDIGTNGELDFIRSARIIERTNSDGTGPIKLNIEIDTKKQKPCILVGGEGLYIAFFGQTGTEMPYMASHLKTADVACDKEYATDKNDDKIITLDDCYRAGDPLRTNMAYFKGSYDASNGSTTFASCSTEYLRGTPQQKEMYRNEGKLSLGTCWKCSVPVIKSCPKINWNNVEEDIEHEIISGSVKLRINSVVPKALVSSSISAGMKANYLYSSSGYALVTMDIPYSSKSFYTTHANKSAVYPLSDNVSATTANGVNITLKNDGISKWIVYDTSNEYSGTGIDRKITNVYQLISEYNVSNYGATFDLSGDGQKLKVECENQIEQCNGEKNDMTEFIFTSDGFLKKQDKTKVPSGERAKFLIYDNYYSDNDGFYTLNFRSGFSQSKDGGIIEMLLNDIEYVFVGKINEYGIREGGILQSFYNRIVKDNEFIILVRVFCVLFMVFLAYMFLFGLLKWELKEYMNILLKLTFVVSFTSYNSWELYNKYILSFFLDGMTDVMMFFTHSAMNVYTDNDYNPVYGQTITSVFGFVDEYIKSMFSTERSAKIWGMFLGMWYGFLAIPLTYYVIIKFIWKLINATFPFILQFIQVVLALICGPVIILLYLFKFKVTEKYFNNWIAFIAGRFINMTFLFVFLNMFAILIRRRIDELTGLCACKWNYWDRVYGAVDNKILNWFRHALSIDVWFNEYASEDLRPTILEYAIGLLGILILIYLFETFLEKIPSVVDNMISIGGSEGGGLKMGSSVLGGAIGKAPGGGGDGFVGLLNQVETSAKDKDGNSIGLGSKLSNDIGFMGGGLLKTMDSKIGEAAFAMGVGDGSSLTNQTVFALGRKIKDGAGQLLDNAAAFLDPGAERYFDSIKRFNDAIATGSDKQTARAEALKAFEESIRKDHPKASDDRIKKEVDAFAKKLDSMYGTHPEGAPKPGTPGSGAPKPGTPGSGAFASRTSPNGMTTEEQRMQELARRVGIENAGSMSPSQLKKALDEKLGKESNKGINDEEKKLREAAKRMGIDDDSSIERMLKDAESKKSDDEKYKQFQKEREAYEEDLKARLDKIKLDEERVASNLLKLAMENEDARKLLTEAVKDDMKQKYPDADLSNVEVSFTMQGVSSNFTIPGTTADNFSMSGLDLANVSMKGLGHDFVMNAELYSNGETGQQPPDKIKQAAIDRQHREETKQKIQEKLDKLEEVKSVKENGE
jgi:hypothetical protein